MEIVNKSQFFKGLEKKLLRMPEKNMKRACQRSADVVRNAAINSIAGGAKSGGVSTRYNPTRQHLSSAAGEAPASDTGFLISSITATIEKNGKTVDGVVTASSPYAAHLEFGTMAMSARPFMRPSLLENKDKIKRIFLSEGVIS